jgi:hypothetical protein
MYGKRRPVLVKYCLMRLRVSDGGGSLKISFPRWSNRRLSIGPRGEGGREALTKPPSYAGVSASSPVGAPLSVAQLPMALHK